MAEDAPRTFISFDFDHDEKLKILFTGQSKLSKTPFSIKDWSSKSSLPQAEWEKKIKEKIGKCHLLIVLVGKNISSATGVKKEIKMAKDHNVPLFGVYIDDTNNSSTLPEGLQRNRTITWTWDGIAKAIDQMMTEGKNK